MRGTVVTSECWAAARQYSSSINWAGQRELESRRRNDVYLLALRMPYSRSSLPALSLSSSEGWEGRDMVRREMKSWIGEVASLAGAYLS